MSDKDPEMQIPKESNLERTEEVLQRQASVPGEKRDDLLVHNFPQAALLAQTLKEMKFPATKKTIIGFLEEHRSNESDTKKLFDLVQKLPDQREYYNVFEIAEAAKLVDASFK